MMKKYNKFDIWLYDNQSYFFALSVTPIAFFINYWPIGIWFLGLQLVSLLLYIKSSL